MKTGCLTPSSPVRMYFRNDRTVRPLFAFYVNHFAAFVKATVGANVMRQACFATVRAVHQFSRFQRIVCPTAVSTAFRNFAFWQRGHNLLLKYSHSHKCPPFGRLDNYMGKYGRCQEIFWLNLYQKHQNQIYLQRLTQIPHAIISGLS